MHHDDACPTGNGHFRPTLATAGREIGADFAGVDGWRVHGTEVAGFRSIRTRGFETVTYVRNGVIDHSDSLGAARFGHKAPWLTAGRGIVPSEMCPLLDDDQPNRWSSSRSRLNLPAESKLVEPHFWRMLWAGDVPVVHHKHDDAGRVVTVTVTVRRSARRARPTLAAARLVGVRRRRRRRHLGRALEPDASWSVPATHVAGAQP